MAEYSDQSITHLIDLARGVVVTVPSLQESVDLLETATIRGIVITLKYNKEQRDEGGWWTLTPVGRDRFEPVILPIPQPLVPKRSVLPEPNWGDETPWRIPSTPVRGKVYPKRVAI